VLHTYLYIELANSFNIGCDPLPRGGLPPGAEIGYVYDWLRQRQRKTEEERKRKKIKKLAKRTGKIKHKELNRIVKTVENVKKHLEEEKKHLERVK
jgi:hypothetical protein